MSDKNPEYLPEDQVDYTCHPPPYVSDDGSGVGGSEELQPSSTSHSSQPDEAQVQQEASSSKGSTNIWRRALRRVIPDTSRKPKNKARLEIAPQLRGRRMWVKVISEEFTDSVNLPRWCGHGAMSTKKPLPILPNILGDGYTVDVLCWPPPLPFVAESARWQQARLYFSTDNLSRLRGPIPWRANIEDHCHSDMIHLVNFPYPVPFFLDEVSGKIKAYHNMPHNTSIGGLTYERTIALGLQHDSPQRADWFVGLSLTSQDGAWLSSLSRADAAALVGLDSAIR
ncbi:hypothetical protein B0T21DRAFT_407854 [Apiosordaria backusii]|uniref:Uncharacterized protein n=1 Tax=Apiosordaria backusii TaxID=314023 RepID=A0AA40K3S1_9PEZI|nr:hypothetical protein B0T21DRAFT_407854 [Apiosordaria backusii]